MVAKHWVLYHGVYLSQVNVKMSHNAWFSLEQGKVIGAPFGFVCWKTKQGQFATEFKRSDSPSRFHDAIYVGEASSHKRHRLNRLDLPETSDECITYLSNNIQ